MSENSPSNTFDVVVIGAGPAGENAADRARRGGLTVAIVERRLVGGECSFYACSPSKAILRPVHAARAAQRVRGVVGARVDPAGVLARRDEFVSNYDDSDATGWLDDAGITLLRGGARFTGERTLDVDGRTITAGVAVVVATGSNPTVPPILGLREAAPWTNIEATAVSTVPDSLVVLGGGVVACELAQAFAALGSSVTVIERGDRLLGRAEPFAGERVAAAMGEDGIDVRLSTEATKVERPEPGGAVTVTTRRGDTVIADQILCALGRTPNTADLHLDAIGVEVNEHGYLDVDDSLAVRGMDGEPWLYAVGDVNGIDLLTHMGKYQARICGDVIVWRARAAANGDGGPPARQPTGIAGGPPQVIFTDPEVASVGYTAASATDAGLDIRVVDVDMSKVAGAGLQADGYSGQARLIVDEARRVVVGATFVGQDMAELVHGATIAIVGEVPLDRLWLAVPSFPTMSEVWLRLLEEFGL